ncbi:GNAT family N-acetyltransferase [Cytobacillus gottheilii]|uniref:GNAT family N-acetyltransferase n=1 Tax=Cytobacillus gottheilii TaxID=859144 RepID=UPI0009BBF219|nr:GNAT family N-acetyltransferase [Cytobacillus gottheilii]
MMFKTDINGITAEMLGGFFVDWPNPPSSETHLQLLKNSTKVVVALDGNQVVGFITAISDGVLSAYIPLLEVLPEYKNKGIGKELVNIMLEELSDIYMIDLCCDDDVVPFYNQFKMMKTNGMIVRNYDHQSGSKRMVTK